MLKIKLLEILNIEPSLLKHPVSSVHGDFTTNIALIEAKKKNADPMTIAKEWTAQIPANDIIEKIEIVPPGFINIFLKPQILVEACQKIVEETDNYGNSKAQSNREIAIEYTDPNPFKEFHLGHLYSNLVGESIARLLEGQGATVTRVNYQGDVGLHVARAIWGMRRLLDEKDKTLDEIERLQLQDKVKFLGEAYTLGARLYEEEPKVAAEIMEINKKIYDKDPEFEKIYEAGKKWSLEHFETIYKLLGNNRGKGKFDEYFFESEVGEFGLKIVKKNPSLFENSEGAVIFPGKKYGLHNRVFITSLGFPTYEAKELGLALLKYEKLRYDYSIIVTGREILEYFKVLLFVLNKVDPRLAAATRHITHGMVRMPGIKMSSRLGNVITADWLIDEISRQIEPKLDPATTQKIALAAIKYSLLKSGIERDVEFDIGKSLSLEGDSGPYLLYTYVRTHSLLEKANFQITNNKYQIADLNNEELNLLRKLYQYPEVVENAGKNYSPHIVANYLYNLAKDFNLFYQKHQILKAKEDIKTFRLLITRATGQIIKNGLYLLGIETVEKM